MFVFASREVCAAAGTFTPQIGDTRVCGMPDVPTKIREFLEYRLGVTLSQESSSVNVGAELLQEGDFSVKSTLQDLTQSLQSFQPHRDVGRRNSIYCRQKLKDRASARWGQLCSLATVSRPGFCDRLARIASCMNSLQLSNTHRENDLAHESPAASRYVEIFLAAPSGRASVR